MSKVRISYFVFSTTISRTILCNIITITDINSDMPLSPYSGTYWSGINSRYRMNFFCCIFKLS
nr:MAG TPA: hypothetical protein [Bacteriophage sp.]